MSDKGKKRGRKSIQELYAEEYPDEPLPWFLDPHRAPVLPGPIDPSVAATLAAIPDSDEAEEDEFAEMADTEVPKWGKDDRPYDQRLYSYASQMLGAPGRFFTNIDLESKGRVVKDPVMIFSLEEVKTQFYSVLNSPASIRRFFKPIPPRRIQVLEPGVYYRALLMRWDSRNKDWIVGKDKELLFKPTHRTYIAVSVKNMHDFMKKINSPEISENLIVKPFEIEDNNVFLIKKDPYPQRALEGDPYGDTAVAYGKIRKRK